MLAALRTRLITFLAPTRLWDWWEFKVPVFLGVACLSAVAAGVGWEALWPRLLVVIAALVPVASYVCVINEITDRRDDALAGKPNCMIGRSLGYRAAWVVACLASGVGGLWALQGNTIAMRLYTANWLAFTLYSVPPVRLKARGVWGVVADASGGQLLPTLWTAAFLAGGGSGSVPRGFTAALGVWAFALGCRGILAHQLRDLVADRVAGVATLAARLGADRVQFLLRFVLLPVEAVAFAAAATLGGAWPAAAAWVAWGVIDLVRRRWARSESESGEAGSSGFAFYLTAFPIVGILLLGMRDPRALSLVPLDVALFPGCWGLSLAGLARVFGGRQAMPRAADELPVTADEVTVVIPAYRGAATIRRCLEALSCQDAVGRPHVVVVESSGDGAADIVEREFPSVHVVRATERLSAGAARNHGAALARGRYILFVDQDCTVPHDWVQRIVRHLRQPGIDAVGGSIGIANPGNFSGNAVYFLEFMHQFPGRGPVRLDAPFLLGSNAGYRAEVLEAVQFPDRTLAEDVLFTARVRQAGFVVAYDPSITVLHHNRSGWGEFVTYARQMGRASADYHATLDLPWARPFLRWPALVFPASLAVSPLIALRLLRSLWTNLGLFLLVAPACVVGNLVWAAAFRRRVLEKRSELQPAGDAVSRA